MSEKLGRLTSVIRADREYQSYAATLREQLAAPKTLPIVVNGMCAGAADAFLCESVRDVIEGEGTALILVASEGESDRVAQMLGRNDICARTYPARDLVFHNVSASRETERERLAVLAALREGALRAIVTTASAAALHTMPRQKLDALSLHLRVGDILSIEELSLRLERLGFARVDMVESAGQYAHRGGIVDLYADEGRDPVRIEFFGDEIDRMGYFDPDTQRFGEPCEEVRLLPAAEVIADDAAKARVCDAIRRALAGERDAQIAAQLGRELAAVEADLPLNARDKYLPRIYPEGESLFDYFDTPHPIAVFVLDTNGVREDLQKRIEVCRSATAAPHEGYIADEGRVDRFLERNVPIHINPFSGGLGTMRVAGLFGFRTRRAVSYGGNPAMLFEDVGNLRRGQYRTLIAAENRAGADSLLSSLEQEGIAAYIVEDPAAIDLPALRPGGVCLTVADVEYGYELLMPKIALLSMKHDTGRAVLRHRRQQSILRRAGGAGERILNYADLSVGDHIVHRHYGIGLFTGIETVKVEGVLRDYIAIQYAGTDRLLVPCDRLECIGKYIGTRDTDGKVKLSKIGGAAWERTKERAKHAVKDIAKDLIALYAARQRTPGFAFSADGEMEREFADGFEFEETEGQLRAIEEIGADMQKPIPMNRLLCGDVGFGKTEVALRAAFKAVVCGKQVAILVPTTILAMQHYQTALSRMRGYAVNVEMLTRLRSPKEAATILRRCARGEIDILIGTHKLLSDKVVFRDLGLLIVDEEQRFGVEQKEKLKAFAKNVDTLTLSATPIPRTLNMAMSGISDMSVLDEAPLDRRPVQTYVLEHDESMIADAIGRELSRGGQVLYLYNDIARIDIVAGQIAERFPQARVTFAHGQMDRERLEDIWQSLVRGEIDVIVCTTIIETGIDLPNANTLIIENADRLGLSQLHQIRGRVGRGGRQAYAYFTYRAGKSLSEIATKRLQTIREYAEFGAGFKIALRDLEIRGAGNLLGAEQHGYIDGVGYDLYVRLLSEAVLEEQGKSVEPPFESTVDIAIDAIIPDTYIATGARRMEMYKKISLIRTVEDAEDIIDEFIDRFGDPPTEVVRLVRIAYIRAAAARAKIRRVECREGWLRFHAEQPNLAVWSELFCEYEGIGFRNVSGKPTVCYRLSRSEDGLDTAFSIMGRYDRLCKERSAQEGEKQA